MQSRVNAADSLIEHLLGGSIRKPTIERPLLKQFALVNIVLPLLTLAQRMRGTSL